MMRRDPPKFGLSPVRPMAAVAARRDFQMYLPSSTPIVGEADPPPPLEAWQVRSASPECVVFVRGTETKGPVRSYLTARLSREQGLFSAPDGAGDPMPSADDTVEVAAVSERDIPEGADWPFGGELTATAAQDVPAEKVAAGAGEQQAALAEDILRGPMSAPGGGGEDFDSTWGDADEPLGTPEEAVPLVAVKSREGTRETAAVAASLASTQPVYTAAVVVPPPPPAAPFVPTVTAEITDPPPPVLPFSSPVPRESSPSSGPPESDAKAPRAMSDPGPLESTDSGARVNAVPAEVVSPVGNWTRLPPAPKDRNFGGFSSAGPRAAEEDKGNQDFEFHLEVQDRAGQTWVLMGVADGVSQSTWSARGARHASAAFIEAAQALLAEPAAEAAEGVLRGDGWPARFASRFHEAAMRRTREDRDYLLAEGFTDPTYTREVFEAEFLAGPKAKENVNKWFQSTLLGVAMGKTGGFGLFLGDGFARVDREFADGRRETASVLQPTRPVSAWLTQQEVHAGIVRFASKGARRLGVVVTTDGVSKSSARALTKAAQTLLRSGRTEQHPLERIDFRSPKDCQSFLQRLAAMSPPEVEADNMSIAFVVCAQDPEPRP